MHPAEKSLASNGVFGYAILDGFTFLFVHISFVGIRPLNQDLIKQFDNYTVK